MKTMKNILSMKLMSLLVMFVMVAFSSCTEDEDGVVEPTFPELKELSGEVGQTLDIAFTANVDWKLTSSAAWCKFVNGDFLETTASGKAGDQTLKVQISDESLNYETDDVAELSLTMGDKTQVIYKITRGKREYQNLVVTDADGNEVTAESGIVIKGNTLSIVYTSLKAEAEAGTQIGVECPDWLTMNYNSTTGYYDFTFNTDKTTNGGLDFRNPYSDNSSVITFLTDDAETAQTDKVRKISIPVSYEGFDKRTLIVSSPYMNVTVSYDGKANVNGVEMATLNSEITAFKNDFEIVVGTQTQKTVGGGTVYEYDFSAGVNWLHVTKNASNVSISFDENTTQSARNVIVMALPRELAEEGKANYNAYLLDETGDIKSSLNTFILLAAEQDGTVVAEEEISFICRAVDTGEGLMSWGDSGMNDLNAVKINDSSLLSSIKAQYPGLTTKNIWSISITADRSEYMSFMPFIFEAVGRGTGQTLTHLTTSTTVTCSSDELHGTIGTKLGTEDIYGLAIGGTIDDYYDIALKNSDGSIAAFCRIELAK